MKPLHLFEAVNFRILFLLGLVCAALTPSSNAQITDVTIGITPACPYGLGACWGGAYDALTRLNGIKAVADNPDTYNSTAVVRTEPSALPDLKQWEKQFKTEVGSNHILRGVEITGDGTVVAQGAELSLVLPGVTQLIKLLPLKEKIQWNSKKHKTRGPEEEEKLAYESLLKTVQNTPGKPFRAKVTGPLHQSASGYEMEVREYFQYQ